MNKEDLLKAKVGDKVFFDDEQHWAKYWQGAVVCNRPARWESPGVPFYCGCLTFKNEEGHLGLMGAEHITGIFTFGNSKSEAITKIIDECVEHPNDYHIGDGALFVRISRIGVKQRNHAFLKPFEDYYNDNDRQFGHDYDLKLMLASWLIHMDEEDLNLFINEE